MGMKREKRNEEREKRKEKNETEAIDFDWKTAKTRFKREINNQRNQNFYFPRTQVERKLSLDRKTQKRKDIFLKVPEHMRPTKLSLGL